MVKGSTPVFTVSIPSYNLSGTTVHITLDDGRTQVDLSGDRLTVVGDENESIVTFSLTQRETLMFENNKTEIQARFITADGTASVTEKKTISIYPVLLRRVITHD